MTLAAKITALLTSLHGQDLRRLNYTEQQALCDQCDRVSRLLKAQAFPRASGAPAIGVLGELREGKRSP
jgi:hypothetical protein